MLKTILIVTIMVANLLQVEQAYRDELDYRVGARGHSALDEFTTAIQRPPATVIGVHTGAEIALEFGLRFPEKTDFLIFDGLALFNEEESADILEHYLPPFIPDWDGSHLT